jgi:hypothetical protein
VMAFAASAARESSRDRTAHETVPFFNNLEILLDLTLSFQAKCFYILLRMSRSHKCDESAPYPQTPWGYMVK